ncbi:MAG: nucleotidyltransferase family protein [Candidatus Omnitrophica bacterium]|nr:nucleotidyltransferase family protein [Candidatus Omnitrophota bacterium]
MIRFIVKVMLNIQEESSKDLLKNYSLDWEKFKRILIYHELAPFAYSAFKNLDFYLPEEFREFLKMSSFFSLFRNQFIWQEFLRIYDTFKKEGIKVLPIKGIALLADIYLHQPLRPMQDIDLLIKEKDIKRAEEVFFNLGYRKDLEGLKEEYWKKHQCHITFYRKGKISFWVELHWGIDFKRKGRLILLPELWQRTRKLNLGNQTIEILSPEDTFFSLALHKRRFGTILCFKNSYDLILLLNKYATDFDWNYIFYQSKNYNLYSLVFFFLYQTQLLFDLNLPEYIWEKLKLSNLKKKLIQQLIEKNILLVPQDDQLKDVYLKTHFLIYDNFWEPIEYIINIPLEQFAKFYNLKPYEKKTNFLYHNRLFYIPLKKICNLLDL